MALEEFKLFLHNNRGKLKLETIDQTIAILDRYMNDLVRNPAERIQVRELMQEAYSLDAPSLRAYLERGRMQRGDHQDTFIGLVPDGLFRNYLTLVQSTESPTSFHFFSLMSIVAALLERRVWVEQNIYQVQPAFQVLLAGPTAVKKNAAAEFAIKIGREASDGKMFEISYTTPEKLYSMLAARRPSTAMLYIPELTAAISRKKYHQGFVNRLTDIFDSRDYIPVDTHARNREELRDVAVSALLCSNERYLIRDMPESAFEGGFISRIIPVYEPMLDPTRIFPRPPPFDPDLRNQVIFDLVELERIQGAATLTQQANVLFDKLYRKLRRHQMLDDPKMADWISRVPTGHLLRIALLLSVAEKRREKTYIEDYHIKQSYAILEWIIERVPKLFAFLGTTSVGEETQQIIRVVFENGGRISRQQLMGRLYGKMSARQLEERMHTLRQAGIIAVMEGGLFDEGGTAVYYKLLKNPEDIL